MKTMTPEEYTRERPADLLRFVTGKRSPKRIARDLDKALADDIQRGKGEKHKSAAAYQAAQSRVALNWRRVMKAMNNRGRGGGV